MAEPTETQASLPSDLLYLVTFAVGMGAFWLSGHAGALLPVIHNHNLAIIAGLATTAAVYGLGMLVIALLIVRRLKGTVAAVVVAVVLGLIIAQVVVRLAAGHIHTKQDLGILTFVLYLFYGGIYVLGLSIARRISRIAK